MADVKWIKITTDIFDDEKIMFIEELPDADSIIVIWFKLLCFAGRQNNSGVFIFNDRIAYTEKMLATIFRRKESIVKLALKTFEEFGMIEIVDGVITIPNWGKHQNLDQLEGRKEYMKKYMKEYREKQKLLADGAKDKEANSKVNSKVNSKQDVNEADKNRIEVEEEVEEDKSRNITLSNERVCRKDDFRQVIDAWNSTDFKKVERISGDSVRGGMLRKRLNDYGVNKVIEAIHRANQSKFLKGYNRKGWTADFDWFIKPSNFQKVLEGNYDERETKKQYTGKRSYTFMDIDIGGGSDGKGGGSEVVDIDSSGVSSEFHEDG